MRFRFSFGAGLTGLRFQVTVAAITRIDKNKKVKELKVQTEAIWHSTAVVLCKKADAQKVDEFTKNKADMLQNRIRKLQNVT